MSHVPSAWSLWVSLIDYLARSHLLSLIVGTLYMRCVSNISELKQLLMTLIRNVSLMFTEKFHQKDQEKF